MSEGRSRWRRVVIEEEEESSEDEKMNKAKLKELNESNSTDAWSDGAGFSREGYMVDSFCVQDETEGEEDTDSSSHEDDENTTSSCESLLSSRELDNQARSGIHSFHRGEDDGSARVEELDDEAREALLNLYPELRGSNEQKDEEESSHLPRHRITADRHSFRPLVTESSPRPPSHDTARSASLSADESRNSSPCESENGEGDHEDSFELFLASTRKTRQRDPVDENSSIRDFIVSDSDEEEEEESGDWESDQFEEDATSEEEEEEDEENKENISRGVRGRRGPRLIPPKRPPNTAPISSSSTVEDDDHVFLSSLSPDSNLAHPEARVFKRRFTKSRDLLTHKLFSIFNKRIFSQQLPDLPITWMPRLRKTAGRCLFLRTNNTAQIQLSTKVCTTPGTSEGSVGIVSIFLDRVRDTLIHELCHAATWIIDAHAKAGHGPLWQHWQVPGSRYRLGTCRASRSRQVFPCLAVIERCHNYAITAKFIYECETCKQRVKRHSKSLNVDRKVCGCCRGRFVLLNREGNARREPSAFARFVQANYAKEKKDGKMHRDVMRDLAARFKAQSL